MADIYLISHQYVEYLKNKYHTYQAPDICKIDRFLTSVTEELQVLNLSVQDSSLDQLGTIWQLPQFPSKNSHNFISFIDLIKGIVPTNLTNFLLSLGIAKPQAVSILTKLLSYIHATCWDTIWLP